MSNSSTGTLILTTLLSIVGWLGVTLYSGNSQNRDDIQALRLRMTTMEVTQYVPPKLPPDSLLLLSDSISKVASDHARLKTRVERELEELDRRVDALVRDELERSRDRRPYK